MVPGNDLAEENMRVEYRIVTRTASRHRHSEDAHYVSKGQETRFVAAVADGHGPDVQTDRAQELSKLVARMFVQEYKAHPVPSMAFPSVCDSIQHRVEKTFRRIPVGAVATCVVADEDTLTIAQVGDCVVSRFTPNGDRFIEWLTQDHHPDHPGEVIRLRPFYQTGAFEPIIQQKGNFCITRIHCKKTGATAEFSRSFGDPDFRPIVTHEPEVKTVVHESNDELYAVCSDGGADVVRQTFRRLFETRLLIDESFMHHLEEVAYKELPMRPRDDITIIFFRIMRDLPTP